MNDAGAPSSALGSAPTTNAAALGQLHRLLEGKHKLVADRVEELMLKHVPAASEALSSQRLALSRSVLACLEHVASGADPATLKKTVQDITTLMTAQQFSMVDAMTSVRCFWVGVRRAAYELDPDLAHAALEALEDVGLAHSRMIYEIMLTELGADAATSTGW